METRFIKKQMTAAYQYSYTRLALNYYTLYETILINHIFTDILMESFV